MLDGREPLAWLERDDASKVEVRSSCAIGRAPANQLVLADEKVSRRHALIHRQGENEYWLVDLGSSNGSYLDSRRVTQPVALRDGAVIRIGSSTLVFRQRGGPATPTAVAGDEPRWDLGTIQDIRVVPCWLLLADIESSSELARSLPPDQLPVVTGRWFSECKQAIEVNAGMINKYLGDGFLAYWPGAAPSPAQVIAGLGALKRLQSAGQPAFRVVLHHGEVSMGGTASMGEENLSGPEVNFVFRMEKLAGGLRLRNLMSEAASVRLGELLPSEPAGRHALAGFEGDFAFLTF